MGIILVGGGGHCSAVIDVLERCGLPIAGIVHGVGCEQSAVLGYTPLGRDADIALLRKHHAQAIVALGQTKQSWLRQQLFCMLESHNYDIPTIISPLAYVSRHSKLGRGTVVMHNGLVNARVSIGKNCIINTKTLVEHDCTIGDHCHMAVGTTLCGRVCIGSGTFVGANAVIKDGISVGQNCVIGMGCVVRHNIADGETFYG